MAVAVCAALGLLAGLAVVVAYQKLDGNLTVVEDFGTLVRNRPTVSPLPSPDEGQSAPAAPLNILVIGSDTREGKGNGIDDENPGQRADVTIILHLSSDRKFAYGVSIARDTVVERPECYLENGKTVPAGQAQWNDAYEYGPACVVQQTEQLTGIRIDDFVEVDFQGFRDMVDALGGVPVCVPEEINDTTGNITLPAGTYEVEGQQALDYVRVRYSVGNGSDVGRMKRQQAFMASMVNKATAAGTLANPIKLYKFLDAATKSLTLSAGLGSLRELAGLARQLQGIGLERVQFTSVPIEPYAPDPNRLQWKPQAADRLWELIREDQPLSGGLAKDVVSADDPVDGVTPSASASAGAEDQTRAQRQAARAAERRREVGLCA